MRAVVSVLVMTLGSAIVTSPAIAAELPPAAAFGSLPAIEDVAISPDGARIAWVATAANNNRSVVIQSIDGGKSFVEPLGPNKERDIQWASNDVVLVTASFTTDLKGELEHKYEFYRTIAVDLTNSHAQVLKAGPDSGNNTSITVSGLTDDGSGEVLIPVFQFDQGSYRTNPDTRLGPANPYRNAMHLTLYRVNPKTGVQHIAAHGEAYTSEFALDKNGSPLARADLNTKTKALDIYAYRGGIWRPVLSLPNQIRASLDFEGLDTDGNLLVLDTRGEHSTLRRLDLNSGALSAPLYDTDKTGVSGTRHDPITRALVGIRAEGGDSQWRLVDADLDGLQTKLGAAFKGKRVGIVSWSRDRQKLAFYVASPSEPAVYYLLDRKTLHADTIGEEYPGLIGAALGDKQAIDYAARDGVRIPGYLTLPPGKVAKNLPLILLPHGGPADFDGPNFDWLSQYLATRGYAVLQPEFRGSTGYGKAWEDAGRQQWGRRMQDDLSDGVKHLISTGMVDPKRVCIVGHSYGGYAALAGATLTPDLYACAVSVAGVSDLPAMLGYENQMGDGDSRAINYWRDDIGSAFDPMVQAESPRYQVKSVKAPILLIHGKDDTVVPFVQTDMMANALRNAGKDVSVVTLQSEDHWLSRGETRVRMLQETGDFLAKYLGK